MRRIFQFRRRREEEELAGEMEAHLEEKVAELMDDGMPEGEARARARREFGNVMQYRETSRDVWGWGWLDTLLQDVRYGARSLRKDPGFTFVAAITLALGIAVNSSIFSIVSAWMLRKPDLPDPDRIVAVVSTNTARALDRGRISPADYLAWRQASRSFNDLAAVDPDHDFNLTGSGDPERVAGMRVTVNYFRTLGVPAFLGRTFLEGEDQPGHDHVILLTYGFWQRRFAADPNAVGTTVTIDGEKYLVAGVLPASFRQVAFLPRLFMPLVVDAGRQERRRSLLLFGRLKAGVSVEQARAEVAGLARRAEQDHPVAEKGWGANAMTLQEYGIQEDQIRAGLMLFMTTVALVLVIACANIANLLLARGAKRGQEIAIRIAVGAGRMRVIRQLLVESLLIALIGGGAGLLAAYWGTQLLRRIMTFNEYISVLSAGIGLDHRVLIFTCLISVGAALVFGLAPAICVSAADPQRTLRQGGRAGDLGRNLGRNLLVAGQIVLAVMLVTSAGLMIKATSEELGGDFGFDPHNVLVAPVTLTSARYREPARRYAFLESTAEKLRALPGVQAATVANAVPFTAEQRAFSIQGETPTPGVEPPRARYFAMSPEGFQVLGIRMIQGRGFRDSDNATGPRVAIVNRVFAEHFFPGKSPLGRYIRIDHDSPGWSEIVGIAGTIRASYLPKEEDAQVYEPYVQVPTDPEMWIALRSAGDANRMAQAVRSAVWSVDPDQPVGKVETIWSLIDEQDGGEYSFDALLAAFGAMALLLAAVGIYGVAAYAAAQGTREIGIRMALGAGRGDVLRSVLGKGIVLALGSAGLGLLASAPLPSLFSAMLHGFRVHSLSIFVWVPLLFLVIVLAAMYVPAARAARVDPIEALRYE